MTQPKTRRQMIEEANARVFSAINALMAQLSKTDPEAYEKAGSEGGIACNELEKHDTTSDEWTDFSSIQIQDTETRALAFKVAQAVLVRNGYRDGLPYCPLCGKLGNPEHNGAPLIDGKVCEACNQRKVIPARIRAMQKEEE